MSVIFVIVVVISVISLISLFKQAMQPQTEPSNVYVGGMIEYYVYGCLGQTITYSLMLLATIIFIIAAVIPKTYDDYLLGRVVWQPILVIWMFALVWPGIEFGMGLSSPNAQFPKLGRFLGRLALIVSSCFALLILPLMGESYERTVQVLWNEPTILTGAIQDKFYYTGTRGGATYYVVIDDVEYQVPYSGWYNSWQEGQTITFLIAPAGVSGVTEIFPSDEVGHTWVSMVLATGGVGTWLITAVMVYYGMVGVIGRFRSRNSTAPPQPIMLEKKPIKSPKVIELAKPVNYWLLGGGVLMLLFSYLYSLKKTKKR